MRFFRHLVAANFNLRLGIVCHAQFVDCSTQAESLRLANLKNTMIFAANIELLKNIDKKKSDR
ncbi:MAG: hypothetical protein F9K48_03750 [Candidatus Brocadia sp.]|nr:MAG: hypothetical protein F9K48_03750 [Candidatus Brocadia sp.]